MVIKPIEFAMIQQQNNVSKAQHNAETRPMTEQQGITQQVEKNVEQHSQQVNKKDNADNEKGHYDAKDKSNNVLLRENSSRAACPPHSNTGNMSPKIPAKAKGINNFIEVDNLILLYNF